jgi:hypothetical protein
VLLSRNSVRISVACSQHGDTRERDLTWQLASSVKGLTSDGETLIFEDELIAAPPPLYRRSIDGSPAVPIGSGSNATLSPDGRWVLAWSGQNLVLLPTGVGAMMTLPKGNVVPVGDGGWLADSKRIVFTGHPGDNIPRGYIQDIPAGTPRPITPPGVVLAGRAAARDHDSILGRVGTTWTLFSIAGGDARPVDALRPADIPLQWSHGGRFEYTVESVSGARPAAAEVFRVDLVTGGRTLWKTLTPSDPVGVEDMRETVVLTPDAQSYCYSYLRRLGDLFVVDGLK